MSSVQPVTRSNPSIPASASETGNDRVATLMQEVIQDKEKLYKTADTERFNLTEAVQIGGDLFGMGYLSFQGAQIIAPSLASIAGIQMATTICGVAAGAINIGVAIVCLKEGIQAWINGDKKLAARLFLDFFCLFGIGVIMALNSLADQLGALSAIKAFFKLHPWLLPVLFFVISLPIIVELTYRIQAIARRADLGSHIQNAKQVQTLIQGKEQTNPYHLKPLIELAEKNPQDPEIRKKLSEKMEQLQANIGVEAALASFRLMLSALKGEKTEEGFNLVKQKIEEWNRAQYVRMCQQALYTAAFFVSMIALKPRFNTKILNGSQTFAMAGANAIPLYMDTFWPFKRNTPIVVPKVD